MTTGFDRLVDMCHSRFQRDVKIYNTLSFTSSFLIVPMSKKRKSAVYKAKDRSVSAINDAAFEAIRDIYEMDGFTVNITPKERKVADRFVDTPKRRKPIFKRRIQTSNNDAYWPVWCAIALKSSYKHAFKRTKDGEWRVTCVYKGREGYTTTAVADSRHPALKRAARRLAQHVAHLFDHKQRVDLADKAMAEMDKRATFIYYSF